MSVFIMILPFINLAIALMNLYFFVLYKTKVEFLLSVLNFVAFVVQIFNYARS
jgi:hypothetical protein